MALGLPVLVLLPLFMSDRWGKTYGAMLLLSLLGFLAVVHELIQPKAVLHRSLLIPVALLLLFASASIPFAPYRHGALESVAFWLALAGPALLIARLREDSFLRICLGVAAFVCFLYASASLFQYAGLLPHAFWAGPMRLAGPFVNSNLFAAYLIVHLFVSAGLAVDSTASPARLAFIVAALPMVAALVLTVSRGGWMAAVVGMAAMALLLMRGRGSSSRLSWKHALLSAFLVGALAAAIMGLHGFEKVAARLKGAGTYSVGHRLRIWKDTSAMIRSHPLGAGAGMFKYVFPQHRTFPDRFAVNFAHSDLAQTTADLGLQGLAALLMLVVALFGTVIRGAAPGSNGVRSAACATLVSLVFLALYDFPFHKPAVAFSFVWVVCVSLQLVSRPSPETGVRLSRWVLAVLAVLLPVVVAFAAANLAAVRVAADGQTLQSSGRYLHAADAFARAHRLSLGNFVFARDAGDASMRRAAIPINQTPYLKRARSLYHVAAHDNPLDARSHLGIAKTAQMLGSVEEAEDAYRRAVALDPTFGEYYEYLGLFLLRQGRTQQGVSCYLRSVSFGLEPAVRPERFFGLLPQDSAAERIAVIELARTGLLGRFPTVCRRYLSRVGGEKEAIETARVIEKEGTSASVVAYCELAQEYFPASPVIGQMLGVGKATPPGRQ